MVLRFAGLSTCDYWTVAVGRGAEWSRRRAAVIPAAVMSAPPAALAAIRPHSVPVPVPAGGWPVTATGPPPDPVLMAWAAAGGAVDVMIAAVLATVASMEAPRWRRMRNLLCCSP